jgi:hypothetical protein
VSPRCTRKRMALRVGPAGYYSSTWTTGSRTRSDHRGCSQSYEASARWTNKQWTLLILILTVLLMVGVTVVLLSRATIFPGASSATNATGEQVSFSSKSSISELPKTGGP